MTDPTARILLLSESAVSTGIVGHYRLEQVLADAADRGAGLSLEILRVPSTNRLGSLLAHRLPGLSHVDLDGQQPRWHLVHSLLAARTLRRHLRRHGPYDGLVIHTQSIAFGLRLWRPRRLPTIISADVGTRVWRSFGIWRSAGVGTPASLALTERLERRALAAADWVLAWSEWTRDGLPACPTTAVEVWHPGVEALWRASDAGDGPAGPPPGELPLLLFVGGRFAAKGGDAFLAAVRPLVQAGQATAAIVTRDAVPEEPGIEVRSLEPRSPELVHLVQRAALLVLPSLGDAVPWVAIEALAGGCPVVATDVGALREIVGDAGVVQDLGGSELAKVLAELVADPDRMADLRRAARRRGDLYDNVVAARRLVATVRTAKPPPV